MHNLKLVLMQLSGMIQYIHNMPQLSKWNMASSLEHAMKYECPSAKCSEFDSSSVVLLITWFQHNS